jgi:1-deoxy-D-xylulose-5-phosphate synthase
LANDEPAYLRIGGKINESINSSDMPVNRDIDLHIVYSGDVAVIADEAYELLMKRNIKVSIVSMWNLSQSSFDQLLRLNPRKIVTLEEHVLAGGFSSMLLERISDAGLDIEVKRVGISRINPDLVGSQNFLRLEYGVTSEEIVKQALSLLND